MGTQDPRIDDYIAKSAAFARPILVHLREVVHAACPEVEEAVKWRCPHFMYQGMLCGMAAFKQHCTFGFWKGSLIVEGAKDDEAAMGQFGRITRVSELPSRRVLTGYIKKAMKLNEDGVKPAWVAERKVKAKRKVTVPKDLAAALKRSKKAEATFQGFSPSHRREYIEWITEAKREETRAKRIAQAIEWMAEGKPRHWKYVDC